ncbi:MAG TPA: glycosyltransferase [Gaiellales bacterium]|nr:glycosyltransferase [Gaiellales bacterium]
MRPRLLVIVTLAEAGGAQTFASTLVAGLRDRYDVEVAAHGPGGAVADACAVLNVPFHHVRHLVRNPHPYHDAAAVRELRALARRLRPEVVQINSSKAGILARLALAGLGAKTVFTAHGWAFSGRGGAAGTAYATAERAVAPLSDAIVCVSNHDLKLAQERGISARGGVHVIHNGVDALATLSARRPPGDRLVLGCTARLAPPKDVSTLLDALAQPGCERWQLRVFGDGPEREEIEGQRDALDLRDRVTLLGNRDDVPQQLAECDAFALISDWEGLPYSILEAMAAGLPVLASDVGGVPDLVVPGTTGELVPARDAAAAAAVLAAWAADPAALPALGAAGHARARASFSSERMIGLYDALFTALLR